MEFTMLHAVRKTQHFTYTHAAGLALSRMRDVLTNRAVKFIDQARSPLFLYFAPWAPHGPPVPAPGDQDTFANLKPARPPSFSEQDVSDAVALARKSGGKTGR